MRRRGPHGFLLLGGLTTALGGCRAHEASPVEVDASAALADACRALERKRPPDDSFEPGVLRPDARLVHAERKMNEILVYGTDVYFRDANEVVMRLPLGGGDPQVAAPRCGAMNAELAVDGATVCCVESDETAPKCAGCVSFVQVVCVPLGGTSRELIKTRMGSVSGFAIDSTYVYFGELGIKGVSRIRRSDGELLRGPVESAPSVQVSHLVADREMVYWNNHWGIFGSPKSSYLPTGKWQGPESDGPIALDEASVYWADGHPDDYGPAFDDIIWKGDKKRGTFRPLSTGQFSTRFMAVTDRYVYWRTGTFALRRVRKDGGRTDTVGRHLPIYFMAGAGDTVYWKESAAREDEKLYGLPDSWEPPSPR
jgi:hypothetical protein